MVVVETLQVTLAIMSRSVGTLGWRGTHTELPLPTLSSSAHAQAGPYQVRQQQLLQQLSSHLGITAGVDSWWLV